MKLQTILTIFFVALAVLAGVKLLNLEKSMSLYGQSNDVSNVSNPFPVSQVNVSENFQLNENVSASATAFLELPSSSAINSNNESITLVDYFGTVCGDVVCDADESCSICSDCTCNADQTCSNFGVCVAKEACGDSICTSLERTSGGCCTDCGCGANLLCNKNVQVCLPLAQLTPLKLNQSIQTALQLPGYNNYTYITTYDDYYNDKVVKTIVLRCPGNPQFHCEAYIYVDSNGNIVGTEHTV